MARRPEIGNIQLYPDRPLRKSDRNGYVLKFYCPIQGKRIRRNCGTRDRREARKILRECRERLLNGKYVESDGAITELYEIVIPKLEQSANVERTRDGVSWQLCYEKYIEFQRKRRRERSHDDTVSRLGLAELVLAEYVVENEVEGGLLMNNICSLDAFEYLQDTLLDGRHGRYETRSPHTVNSIVRVALAFLRFCHKRGFVESVPVVDKLAVDEAMKGRPITEQEFRLMLEQTETVVGGSSVDSWRFALSILWESGLRVGDLVDFSWDDPRHIRPVWGHPHPTIAIPSSQKNGKVQEIPMLPGLVELLNSVSNPERTGWIIDLKPLEFDVQGDARSFRPARADLVMLVKDYRISAIAKLCCVSPTAVKKWLDSEYPKQGTGLAGTIPDRLANGVRARAERPVGQKLRKSVERLSAERIGRVISSIGEAANVVVEVEDIRRSKRLKFASAHDIRRGVAQRLINMGVSAETLKVIMRHESFATTERYYGAVRSAQVAAAEVAAKLVPNMNSELVGGLVGGIKKAPQLSAEELNVLKALLTKL